ncbi:hypothetical protein, partial [Paenibacillus sp. 32O-W]|uniref:hypothetical protein n=1 Tax=Paenibacillus sp. 32O-W TaxID=1695218 RepID=UPI001C93131A
WLASFQAGFTPATSLDLGLVAPKVHLFQSSQPDLEKKPAIVRQFYPSIPEMGQTRSKRGIFAGIFPMEYKDLPKRCKNASFL